MSVSTNKTFPTTKHTLIEDAFSILNIYGSDTSIDPKNYEFAGRVLNRMVKQWMGNNLWEKKTAFLFMQANQAEYHVNVSSSDNCTLNYVSTTTTADALLGATSVVVTASAGIFANDYIGIVMDNNYTYWAQILSVVGLTINLKVGFALTYKATSGAKIYTYTTKLAAPKNVTHAVRNDDGLRDIPMNFLSYQEYLYLPSKIDNANLPVSYNYDRQLNDAVIRVWPLPSKSDIIVKLSLEQKISNFDVNSDEPDFPDEWHEAIVYGLAVRLAPKWGKHKDQGFASLVEIASNALTTALAFNNEVGSIYMKPSRR